MTKKDDIRQVDEIVRKLRLSKAQREVVHDWMAREKLQDMTYQEIEELAKDVKAFYPRK